MTVSWRHFVLHYLEMVVAMLVGMYALDPVTGAIFAAFDAEGTYHRADVSAVIMGLNMVIGMWVWMWIRGHSNRMNVEMAAAMYAPFILGLFPYWWGWIDGGTLMTGAHVAMFITMLLAMLPRRVDYSHHHGFRWSKKPAAEQEKQPEAVAPE